MKRLKVLQGAEVEHWLTKRKREKKPIACPGNYIRIPAAAWVEFQKLRNRATGKRLTLAEASKAFEEEQNEEV